MATSATQERADRKRKLERELHAIDAKYRGVPLPAEEYDRFERIEAELWGLRQEEEAEGP